MSEAVRVAVLVSGGGTNLQALLDAEGRGELAPATVALVLSNKPGVTALDRARAAGVPAVVVEHGGHESRRDFEDALLAEIDGAGCELVVLAGFMRILTTHFVARFHHRILNTHPALCPAFPGIAAARQAIDYGVKLTGCTVHLVDDGVDTGPIVMQEAVPVEPDDDAAILQRRIQAAEHRLLPEATRLLAQGRLRVDGRRVTIQ